MKIAGQRRRRRAYRFFSLPRPFCPSFGRDWPCKCVADDTIGRYSAQPPTPTPWKKAEVVSPPPPQSFHIKKKGRTKSGGEGERGWGLFADQRILSIHRERQPGLPPPLDSCVRGCGRECRGSLSPSQSIRINPLPSPFHLVCIFSPTNRASLHDDDVDDDHYRPGATRWRHIFRSPPFFDSFL